MSGSMLIGFIVLLVPEAPAGEFDDLHWTEPFQDVERWAMQPSWLGNPSPTASVTTDGQTACFRVDEPQRGMKWSAPMPATALEDQPYLVMRYRAENLDTTRGDYLVYFDDRVPGKELHAVRLCDATADGKWHTAAVDLTALTGGDAVHTVAIQVQANRQGKARLWLDWLALMPQPPEGAEVIERVEVVPPQPDWIAPLAEAKWTPQPSWLANPAAAGKHGVERQGEVTVFRVAEPGRGLKWSCDLPEPISLEGHRYVAMRCRATGARPWGDYTLCVLGKSPEGKPGYEAAIPATELLCDGRWHTLEVDIRRLAAELPSVGVLAVQLQAAGPKATLEVSDIRLVNTRQPTKLADAVDWKPGANFDEFHPVPLDSLAQSHSESWRSHLRIADWFTEPAVTADGIPFALVAEGTDLAATGVRGKSELRIPAAITANEVYLLLLAAFTGPEEPPYGSGKLRSIRDVDRFRLRLEYAGGTADECLPMNVATGQFGIVRGPQVVVAAADGSKRLEAIVLCDLARQAAFAVAAVTVRTGGDRLFPEVLEESPPMRVEGQVAAAPAGWLEAEVVSNGPPALEKLVHVPTDWDYLDEPCPLVSLRVDGKSIRPEELERIAAEEGEPASDFQWYRVGTVEGLRLGLDVEKQGSDGLWITARVENTGSQEHRVALVAPSIGPYRLAEHEQDAFYLVPKRGAALDNRPCSYRERYCGLFPVQFLDTFSPAHGRGLSLQTTDTDCLRKRYLLEKTGAHFTLGVEYPERTLKPGDSLAAAPAILRVTDGDWHRGFEAYRRWVRSWHKPLSPRKPWFREIFNFRQRFLWSLDPLYDAKEGKLHLDRAVDEARREFGGIDYLHLFDWGNCPGLGRIYGRTGDHSPYDHLNGGRDALREAIAGVQARGVPTGLYIEGYLLQERGKLGQEFGPRWQLVGPNGKGMYWPESTEMFVCPGVDAWREVQASTYAAKVRELDVDGMYLDQFGFANVQKDCWSKEHGHEVPSYTVRTEREATRIVRRRIEEAKPNVALYSEETPVDVTSQYQDGSFTYCMSSARRTQTRVPLNVFRFAVPDFKTIEILYCDKPTGSWATGVRWVFFNGEAIWLEGPAAEWFEPETRECIRRCYRILRKHRDAFTGPGPTPLVPTETGGVFANAFPAPGKTVYTLYNSRHRTVRGPMLRIQHIDGATYADAWHRSAADIRIEGAEAVIHFEIGPHGVGCVVVECPAAPPPERSRGAL